MVLNVTDSTIGSKKCEIALFSDAFNVKMIPTILSRWSPPDLPRCIDEFHPKMAQWKRKKRDTKERYDFNLSKRAKRFLKRRREQGE